jgi:two-component system sensor histidine kinase GlrK
MHQNSIELQRLIEDLLDLSTASSRPTKAVDGGDLEAVVVGDLVGKVLAHQKPALLKKDIQVEATLGTVVVPGRPGQLRTIVDNLIGNAVKFTPPGGTLGVSVASEGGHAAIEVWDSGPGVRPAEKALIFDPFFQGSAPGTGTVKGSGLGLAIASEHVRRHGGRLELLESAAGARFRVTLPLRHEGAAT